MHLEALLHRSQLPLDPGDAGELREDHGFQLREAFHLRRAARRLVARGRATLARMWMFT